MYLFDTSAIIDWLYDTRLGDRIDGPISVSVLSLVELLPTAREKDSDALNAINRFFSQIKILPLDEMIAREAASLKYNLRRLGQEKPIIDLLISATAKLNNLKLVTLDNDFQIISDTGKFDLLLLDNNQK